MYIALHILSDMNSKSEALFFRHRQHRPTGLGVYDMLKSEATTPVTPGE